MDGFGARGRWRAHSPRSRRRVGGGRREGEGGALPSLLKSLADSSPLPFPPPPAHTHTYRIPGLPGKPTNHPPTLPPSRRYPTAASSSRRPLPPHQGLSPSSSVLPPQPQPPPSRPDVAADADVQTVKASLSQRPPALAQRRRAGDTQPSLQVVRMARIPESDKPRRRAAAKRQFRCQRAAERLGRTCPESLSHGASGSKSAAGHLNSHVSP